MQTIGIFVTRHAAQLIALCGDAAVRVISERTAGAAGQGDLRQAADSIPLVVGDRAGFVLTSNLPTQCVIAVFALAAVGQAFFQQLTEVVPAQLMAAAIRMTNFQQATLTVVAVVGFVSMGVGLLGDIALTVALVLPASSAALHIDELAIVVVVASRFIFWRYNRNQTPGVVVLVFGDGSQCVFFSDQATFAVIRSLRFRSVGGGLADKSRIFVMYVNLLAAIGVKNEKWKDLFSCVKINPSTFSCPLFSYSSWFDEFLHGFLKGNVSPVIIICSSCITTFFMLLTTNFRFLEFGNNESSKSKYR